MIHQLYSPGLFFLLRIECSFIIIYKENACYLALKISPRNTQHSFRADSLCNSTSAAPSNPPEGEDRMAVGVRSRCTRAPPSSLLIRMAMRISRARQGSKPTNTTTLYVTTDFKDKIMLVIPLAFVEGSDRSSGGNELSRAHQRIPWIALANQSL
ncbi:hypothetical protein SLEP1_g20104 [Rubroshorea leprosula]|uniref:Uncharacterized protein n=1 Tax=Rubroshorea leprosula TaxID=152421 RepID=A0AAV5J1K4_9ROSI|nr:hypothetical protein SLEP1_g20104 [Rubroshorea leprosula]